MSKDKYGEKSREIALRGISGLPAISADQYQHIGKYAGAAVMAAFEMVGGVERLSDWADENPTDFFTKVFPKVISKSQQIEHGGTVTLDDAISRLENMTQGEYTEVQEYDL